MRPSIVLTLAIVSSNLQAQSPSAPPSWVRINPFAAGSLGFTPIIYAEGKFVTGGTNLFYSEDDGQTWWQAKGTPAGDYRALSHGNGLFVAVADRHHTATSEDGISWT